MKTLTQLQAEVGQWGDETFPRSTRDTVLNHFAEEAEELTIDPNEEEAADCAILLIHFAHKCGFDLAEAVEAKLRVNRARTWNTIPEPDGHFKHIEGTP